MEDGRKRAFRLLKEVTEFMREVKPNDRSEIDRRYAIVITMLEKTVAFFDYFINREA